MRKLRLTVELEYNADDTHSDDPEEKRWFYEEVLRCGLPFDQANGLYLHSNFIGDTVGHITVVKVED